MGSWSIVVTAKERLEHTLCFVAYHLDLGASRIFIFCDEANDPAIPYLRTLEQVEVFACDQDHRKARKCIRQERHQNRQIDNANWAYKNCHSDWLIHMDIDEYLVPFESGASIFESLSNMQHDTVQILPMEPVNLDVENGQLIFHGGYSGHEKNLGEELFGRSFHKSLLLEHYSGKCFTRTGLGDVKLMLHRARMPDERTRRATSADIKLLHFTSFGVKNWAKKYLRRYENKRIYPFGTVMTEGKAAHPDLAVFRAIELEMEKTGVDGLERMYRDYKTLLPETLFKLFGHVDVYNFDFDFEKSLGRYFDKHPVSIKCAADLFEWN